MVTSPISTTNYSINTLKKFTLTISVNEYNLKQIHLTEFALFQNLSGNFLTTEVPNNWLEMTEQEQNNFIEDHKWQPLEHLDSDRIIQLVQSAADSLSTLAQQSSSTTERASISWCIEDIEEVAQNSFNATISDENAQTVLKFLVATHDASVGINWEVIYSAIQLLLERKVISLEQISSSP